MGSLQAKAQTLLEEDFETSSTETFSQPIAAGAGWTTVDSYNGSKQAYRWHNYYSDKGTIGGTHVAGWVEEAERAAREGRVVKYE